MKRSKKLKVIIEGVKALRVKLHDETLSDLPFTVFNDFDALIAVLEKERHLYYRAEQEHLHRNKNL